MYNQTIAVDFDGTLHFGKWPDIGEPNEALIYALRQEIKSGAKVILWTCREGELLEKAIEFCKAHNLELAAVNSHTKEQIEWWNNDPRIIGADMYIDDKAYNPSQAVEHLRKLKVIRSYISEGKCEVCTCENKSMLCQDVLCRQAELEFKEKNREVIKSFMQG